MSKSILVFGCGKIGLPLCRKLAGQGHQVDGVRRSPPEAADEPFRYIAADCTDPQSLTAIDRDYDLGIIILPPSRRDEQGYQEIYQQGLTYLLNHFSKFNTPPPCLFVSSTSVYAQNDGGWVDENSPTRPERYNGRYLLEAEQRVLQYHPLSIVIRFSGIYGTGSNRLIESIKTVREVQKTPSYYTNRIHQRDCVGILAFLAKHRLEGKALDSIYLASDNDPVDKWRLMSWLADQYQKPNPIPAALDIDASRNKRCDNRRLRELGYQFEYPSYQQGYLEAI